MNEENNGTRSFATTEQDKPEKQFDIKKIVSISIFAIAIVVVLLFIAALIAQIACKASDGKAPDDNRPGTQTNDIVFETKVVSKSEVTKGILQIATKSNPAYLSDEEIDGLTKLYTSPSRKVGSMEYYTIAGTAQSDRLTFETAENLGALTKALYDELGCNDVTVKYAYFLPRNEGTESYDFPHALGTTVDICLLISNDTYPLSHKPEVLSWINENCYRFGFVNSDPSGEVHDKGTRVPTTQLRYVGIPHATYIMQNNISFEEYVERVKNIHTPNNPLFITGADKKQYAVYYVAVDGVNAVKLPTNYTYTISGNNENGIIVTVNK